MLVETNGFDSDAQRPATYMLAAVAAGEQPDGDVATLVADLVRSRGLTAEQANAKAIEMLAEDRITLRAAEIQRALGVGGGEAMELARAELGAPRLLSGATAPRVT